jgi:hypothetical protein
MAALPQFFLTSSVPAGRADTRTGGACFGLGLSAQLSQFLEVAFLRFGFVGLLIEVELILQDSC